MTGTILASMLVEDTGRSILDSGDAYGRNWQRNRVAAGNDPHQFFEKSPHVTVDNWCGPIMSTYHYLVERLDGPAPEWTERFRDWVYEQPENVYLNSFDSLTEFCDEQDFPNGGYRSDWHGCAGNTYNHENLLSQDFMWRICDTGDFYLVWLSIHGGCDARGGYTNWQAFRIDDYDGICRFLDFDRVDFLMECAVDGPTNGHIEGGRVYVRIDDDDHHLQDLNCEWDKCPFCGAQQTVTGFIPAY